MEPSPPSRREFIQLDAVDPVSGKLFLVQISFERLQIVARRSMGQTREAGFIVPHVLQKPTAIFEGLRMDVDEDQRGVGWRCYCGIPQHSYRTDGTACPPYPRQVYLVFVNQDRIAYNWRWEKADPDEPNLPLNHQGRFKKRLI